MRLTLTVRNLEAVKQSLATKTRAAKERLRDASIEEGQATFDLAQALANRDTNFSADQMVLEYFNDGLSWRIGFIRSRFVGKVNPATGKVVTEFYIQWVLQGTSRMAGNDYLTAALRLRRAKMLARYRRARAER